MRGVVGLNHGAGTGIEVSDVRSRRITLNRRIIDHIVAKPIRTPYLAWAPTTLRRPLEVWRHHREGANGLEPRLNYLFAATKPELHSVVVIVGERDLVAFNVIPLKPKDAKPFRVGELTYVGYDAPYERCPHGCCDYDRPG
jgi:phage-Barnase-EndoU-ColicinE5/D-RelE like nuclease2